MRSIAQIAVAALSGAVIAWVLAVVVLHAMFASGGYTPEAVVDLPPWAVAVIGGGGALMALALVLFTGRSPLPAWVRSAVLGSLAGAAAVVIPTMGTACIFGGASSKMQAPYLDAGLVYGVPVGLVAGAVTALVMGRRQAPGGKIREEGSQGAPQCDGQDLR